MMKKYLWITIIFGLTFFSSSLIQAQFPQDVTGWQNTRWGMSKDELLKTLGKQLTLIPPGKKPIQGNFLEYEIPNYYIEYISLTVRFDMEGEKLNRVILTKWGNEANAAFEKLRMLLSSKYGQNVVNQPERWKKQTEWIFPTTTIVLSLIEPLGDYKLSFTALEYRSNKSKGIDKI
jgi:hypothetical protein